MLAVEYETINSLPSFLLAWDKQKNISDPAMSSGGRENVVKEEEMCEAAEWHYAGFPIFVAMKALNAGWKQTAENEGLDFGLGSAL